MMNAISRLTDRVSGTALKSAAAGAALLTFAVGSTAAQPEQLADLVAFWAPGEGFRNIAEGVYYIVETWT